MKLCKCGMPIYDEPEQRSDKCWFCIKKNLSEVDKRLYTMGINTKDYPSVVGNAEK